MEEEEKKVEQHETEVAADDETAHISIDSTEAVNEQTQTEAKEHERSLKAESQGSSEDSEHDSDEESEDKKPAKRGLFGRATKEEKNRLSFAQAREENRVNEWAWSQVIGGILQVGYCGLQQPNKTFSTEQQTSRVRTVLTYLQLNRCNRSCVGLFKGF